MAKTVDLVLKSTADTTGFKKTNENIKGLGAAAERAAARVFALSPREREIQRIMKMNAGA